MNHIEAMKLALVALQGSGHYDTTQQREAITALRQAIQEAALQKLSDGLMRWSEQAKKKEPNVYGDSNVYRGQRSKDSETKTLYYTAQPEAEKQKPVACQHKRYTVDEHEQTGTCYDCGVQGRMRFIVNETAPPKREWQGLTDEEALALVAYSHPLMSKLSVARAIEAKLKEKNK